LAGIAFSDAVTAYEFCALLAAESDSEKNRADVDAAAAVKEEKKRELDKLQAARRHLETVAVSLKLEQEESEYKRRERALLSAGLHKIAVRIDDLIEALRNAAQELTERERQAMRASGDLVSHIQNANLHLSWIVNDALSENQSFGFKKLVSQPNKKFADLFTTEVLLHAANMKKPAE
jgi:SMC interacting uncharacterized protein involved in chromosome segregation